MKETLIWPNKKYYQIPWQDNPVSTKKKDGKVNCFIICCSDNQDSELLYALYDINNYKAPKAVKLKEFKTIEEAELYSESI